MNRKGFTLIELLAVIFLLGLILVIAAPSITNAYKNSKLKSEEIFVEKLSDVIDGYIKLNSSDFNFTQDGTATKENQIETVTIYKGKNKDDDGTEKDLNMKDIIEGNLITESDYINAGNKDTKCNQNAEIEVYKDSDYVYCHKVKKESLDCLTQEYKDSIVGDYIIDTCTWRKQA